MANLVLLVYLSIRLLVGIYVTQHILVDLTPKRIARISFISYFCLVKTIKRLFLTKNALPIDTLLL